MAEYIEREALVAFLEDVHEDNDWLVNQYNADWICSWIESQPATDVVEVVHGHWISQQEAETINDYGKAYCCSICGHCDWDCTESESFNYCPHCGAKMDGERRSE